MSYKKIIMEYNNTELITYLSIFNAPNKLPSHRKFWSIKKKEKKIS